MQPEELQISNSCQQPHQLGTAIPLRVIASRLCGTVSHTGFARRRLIHIQDFDTYVVSKEDLILSKLIWARDTESQLQIRDVRNLIASGFDQEYVRFWLERLNLIQFFEKISI